jgi:hypothetical protein
VADTRWSKRKNKTQAPKLGQISSLGKFEVPAQFLLDHRRLSTSSQKRELRFETNA